MIEKRTKVENYEYGKSRVVRLRDYEFEALKKMDKLTHYNFHFSGHLVGVEYEFPLIEKPGFFNAETNEEELPVLNFDGCRKGVCTKVKEEVSYEDITEEDIENSFPHMKSVEEIKANILKKYKESLPNLTEEEILEKGVSITYFDLE